MNEGLCSGKDAWFANDRFWENAAQVLFEPAVYAAGRAEAPQIARALGLEPNNSVLDVFCGPGRIAVPLSYDGYRVIGVDRTLSYLKRAAESSSEGPAQRHPQVEGSLRLFQMEFSATGSSQDIKEISVPGDISSVLPRSDQTLAGPVDGAVWLGLSSGYAGRDGDVAVLRWIWKQLAPGASLLMEVSTLEDLSEGAFARAEWFEERDSSGSCTSAAVWKLEHRVTETGWFEGRWRRFCLGILTESNFGYQVYPQEEWLKILLECKYSNVLFKNDLEALGGSSVSVPDERARTWIRATKP